MTLWSRVSRLEAEVSALNERLEEQMTTMEEVTTAVAGLKSDLESLANNATAEFKKLEKELAEGKPANLEPLKLAIDELDAKAKAVVIPTT